ncbi:hypothetical protein AK812_SmicGene46741, partial [Symbiodinium microadriaticum]
MVKGLGCNVVASFRCHLHSAQKTLENCMQADKRTADLMDSLIVGYADSSGLGGFARAIRNSLRLKASYGKHCQELDSVLCKASTGGWSFAPQRFSTVLSVSETLCLNMGPALKTLQESVIRGGRNKEWARRVLAVLKPENMLLLALLCELCKVAQRYVHRWDRSVDQTTVADTALEFERFKLEANRLFSFRSVDGDLQQPLVLSPDFTSGMPQLLRASYNLLQQEAVIDEGLMVYFRPQWDEKTYREAMAKELGAIQNILKHFVDGIDLWHNTAVASAFAPLDVSTWTKRCSDDTLEAVMKPLAQMLGMEVAALSKQYLLARPSFAVLERRGIRCLRVAWSETMKHWGERLPELVALFLATYASTSEVEQNFSFLEMMSSMLRVRLDGLPPHKFVEQRQDTRTQAATFLLSADAAATQQMFLEKFGGGKNACKSDLPRRSRTLQDAEPQTAADVQVQRGKETKASLKRKRALQVAGLNSATEVCEDTQDLEAVAQNSATLRQEESPGFEKLKKALTRNATILRNRFLNMISGDTKKYDDA